ncbi:hypothetical protein FOZ60_010514 [Perkinsus olseni]|uniref:Uncharacterized protein n=1 Tax=Perkinsus olseni TaxID=32597 RepID=A0A7J6PBR1_PEROL|nr:hypothetical protein FOZ60_010514 [Perkinsus olseni]
MGHPFIDNAAVELTLIEVSTSAREIGEVIDASCNIAASHNMKFRVARLWIMREFSDFLQCDKTSTFDGFLEMTRVYQSLLHCSILNGDSLLFVDVEEWIDERQDRAIRGREWMPYFHPLEFQIGTSNAVTRSVSEPS